MTEVQSRYAPAQNGGVSETLRVPTAMLTRLLNVTPALILREYSKGNALYRQEDVSDQVFVIVSGRVGITMLRSDGQEFLIDIVGPGALCGEGAAFDQQARFSSANALGDTTALVIPAAEFCKLMISDVELAPLVVQTIALKQRMLAMRLAQVTHASSEVRIAELLSQIAGPDFPAIRLTHQQIADLIGASRITVTRAMQKLRRDGTLLNKRGYYELVRAPRLGISG